MLLRDRYLASLPALAKIVQVGEHDLGQQRVESRHAEERIEDRLGVRLVERVQRGREIPADGLRFERQRLLLSGPQRQSRGLGRSEPFREVLLHEAHALEVFVGVETKTSGRPRWLKQAVPLLPCAKQFRADAGAPAELAYAEEACFHVLTIQHLDSYLTSGVDTCYCRRRTVSIQEVNRMKSLDLLAATLLIVGGLNWGLVAVADFDLVAWIVGLEFGETNAVSRFVYGLVGIAAIYAIGSLVTRARGVSPAPVEAR